MAEVRSCDPANQPAIFPSKAVKMGPSLLPWPAAQASGLLTSLCCIIGAFAALPRPLRQRTRSTIASCTATSQDRAQ